MTPQPRCPVCESARWRTWSRLTINPGRDVLWDLCLRHIVRGARLHQELRLCLHCGCLFRSPVWDETELQQLYSSEIWQLVEPYRPKTERALGNNETRRRHIVDTILHSAPAGNGTRQPAILDIGGRDGYYVAPFLDRGWTVWSLDSVGIPMVDGRIRSLPGRFESADLHEACDVIVLSHVLEHIVALRAFLEKIGEALRPDGIVFVEVPYEVPRVLLRRDLGDPSHQVYFATRTLRYLCEAAGLVVRCCRRSRSTYDASELLSIMLVAGKRSHESPQHHLTLPGWLHVLAEMGSPAVLAFALRERWRRHG